MRVGIGSQDHGVTEILSFTCSYPSPLVLALLLLSYIAIQSWAVLSDPFARNNIVAIFQGAAVTNMFQAIFNRIVLTFSAVANGYPVS